MRLVALFSLLAATRLEALPFISSVFPFSRASKKPRSLQQAEANRTSLASPRGSLPSGQWECAAKFLDDVWQDENYGPVSARLTRKDITTVLTGKWLMIVGDSTMRMVYHLLLGMLRWNWAEWPADMNNHGPTYFTAPRQSFPLNCNLSHNLKTDENYCLQDSLTAGIRLSFMWVDYADKDQLSPLSALEKKQTAAARVWPRSNPDALVLSMGAWHIRGERLTDLEANLKSAMMRLEGQFPESHKIVTGTPNCNNNPEADTASTDRISRSVLTARPGWVWFDRGSITRHVCEGEHACRLGWPHPSGAPLNAVTKLLLWQVQDASPPVPPEHLSNLRRIGR